MPTIAATEQELNESVCADGRIPAGLIPTARGLSKLKSGALCGGNRGPILELAILQIPETGGQQRIDPPRDSLACIGAEQIELEGPLRRAVGELLQRKSLWISAAVDIVGIVMRWSITGTASRIPAVVLQMIVLDPKRAVRAEQPWCKFQDDVTQEVRNAFDRRNVGKHDRRERQLEIGADR